MLDVRVPAGTRAEDVRDAIGATLDETRQAGQFRAGWLVGQVLIRPGEAERHEYKPDPEATPGWPCQVCGLLRHNLVHIGEGTPSVPMSTQHMYAFTTVCRTAMAQTALCSLHRDIGTCRTRSRQAAQAASDWDQGRMHDCTGHASLSCIVCGATVLPEPNLGLAGLFSPDEVEALIRSAAGLWHQTNPYNPHYGLSAQQRELLDRAAAGWFAETEADV